MKFKKSIFYLATFVLFFIYCRAAIAAKLSTDIHFNNNIHLVNNEYISPIIQFKKPVEQAIISWNAITPNKSYLKFYLRAQTSDGKWTNWFLMAKWGENIRSKTHNMENKLGAVDIDTLILKSPSTAWQYRIAAHNIKDNNPPVIYSAALAVRDSQAFKKKIGNITHQIGPLKVPTISQFETGKAEGIEKLSRRICSPTSITMMLRYYNIQGTTLTSIANKTYDGGAKMFGNWAFGTAIIFNEYRKQKPLDNIKTYVRWYESLDDILNHIRKGNPVIVSVGYKEGELQGAPLPTAGHLLLIRGGDERYIYVNDPAAPENKTVARKYRKDEFLKAWKGVTYILEKLDKNLED